MTEQEAKTKWCPFARVATQHAEGRPINRVGSDEDVPSLRDMLFKEADCIGSACMAWRVESHIEHASGADRPVGEGWEDPGYGRQWRRKVETGGFCGLAGKP